ncbi:MAG: protein kinase [Phycisphaerae bacterium]|nr:protein kinase [Planctomycetia bacterium]MCL4720209.1 protein kinase [Phycisphaerae bacterium]
MDRELARVRALFDEVLQTSPEGRPALLAARCGSDSILKRRVEALVATAESEDPFLSQPTRTEALTAPAPALSERPGARIGPYKLLQQIGEGGFGVVFMAEQDQPVRRRVALKIIKLGMDTRQVVARFEQERQALALMDHPNIAKVLDAGATDSGRPYFVMEYVKGDPITEFADAHRLNVADRLQLFAQVCAAVQHAHTKGVVHRDLKPRNVLVNMTDGKPFAKVIDFGIAKATGARLTDKTLFTEHRQLIGTPEYMSPEQAEGSPDIDTRTDVYSLGVLLYELLTGATPFDAERLRSAAYAEMQRIIKEEDPPAPSVRLSRGLATLAATAAARQAEPANLGVLVKGDLDWIVMKALDKDRTRRYESPSQLAADVQRHLSGEPVAAAPPGAGYRIRKFARRNRSLVIAGTSIAVAMLLGVAGTTWQWWRADEANRELRDEITRARLGEAAAEYARWAWYKDAWAQGTEARVAFQSIVATRAELLGSDHLDTIKAEWMLTVAGRDDRFGDDAAWWKATDGGFDALADRLDRAGGHADTELADWYGRALHYAFVRLDPDATMRWASRCGKAMAELFKADGLNAACVPYRRLTDILPVPRSNEITAPMIDEMARRVAGLNRPRILELMATSARTKEYDESLATMARNCLATSPDDPHALTALAVAQLGINTPDEAMRTATIAATEWAKAGMPESPAHAAVVAMCMQRLGRAEESRAELVRAGALAQADPLQQSTCAGILAEAAELIDPQPTPEERLAAEAKARHAAEYRENISVASMALAVGDVATARNRLTACEPELRGWEWRYLTARSDTSVRVLDDGEKSVGRAAFSPDGSRVATAGSDARVWDMATGALLATLSAEGDSDYVAFSPDGGRLLVCGFKSAVVWDIAAQRTVVTLPVVTPDGSPHGAFSPDGARILMWEWAKPPQVWDARTGVLIVTLPLEMDGDKAKDGLGDAAFSPDGTRVVTGHFDHVKVWDTGAGALLHTLACDKEQAGEIEVSPDGRWIMGFGFSSKVIIWDAATGEVRATLVINGQRGLVDAGFSRDGSRVVTSGYGRGVQVWDVAAGALVRDLTVERPSGWHAARFAPDGERLVVWGVGTPGVFDIATGERVLDFVGHEGDVFEAQFSPDGATVLTSGDGTVRLWDARARPNPHSLRAHEEPVTSLHFSADGQRLLSADYRQWRTWGMETGRPGASFTNALTGLYANYDRRAAFLPDGRILSWIDAAEIFDSSDGAVALTIVPPSERGHDEDMGDYPSKPIYAASVGGARVLTATKDGFRITDSRTGALVLEKDAPGSRYAELSPDGGRALAVIFTESVVRVFDAATGQSLFDLPGQLAKFDPAGARILTLSRTNRGARIWDARTGQAVSVLDLPPDLWSNKRVTEWQVWQLLLRHVDSFAFSPDGAHVVIPAAENYESSDVSTGTAHIYDVRTGRRLAELRSEFGGYCRIAFSPDGKRIATCRWGDSDATGSIRDGGIRLWDAQSGLQLMQLPVPSQDGYGICSLAWSPDGDRLAAGGYDGQVSIFEVPPSTQTRNHP